MFSHAVDFNNLSLLSMHQADYMDRPSICKKNSPNKLTFSHFLLVLFIDSLSVHPHVTYEVTKKPNWKSVSFKKNCVQQ